MWCSFLTRSLRRSSVKGGIGTRISLPSFDGFKPEIGRADGLFDRADLRDIPRLHGDQGGLGDVQVGNLIERRRRTVVIGAHVVQQADRSAPGPDAGHIVLQIASTFSMRLLVFASISLRL